MNGSDLPHLHAYRDPANADDLAEAVPCADAHTLIANLKRIGKGAAADGQPWPERHQLPGRCMALADSDCALAGLRVVQEVLLAAERTRQNGEPEDYVGDRVMEGLMLACLALSAQAVGRLQVEGCTGLAWNAPCASRLTSEREKAHRYCSPPPFVSRVTPSQQQHCPSLTRLPPSFRTEQQERSEQGRCIPPG
ncbi:MAG: hypothetical protein ACRER5_03990 [Pseudomonas sp.]